MCDVFLLNSTLSKAPVLTSHLLGEKKQQQKKTPHPHKLLNIKQQISPHVCILPMLGERDAHDKAENGKKADLYMALERWNKMKMCFVLHFSDTVH